VVTGRPASPAGTDAGAEARGCWLLVSFLAGRRMRMAPPARTRCWPGRPRRGPDEPDAGRDARSVALRARDARIGPATTVAGGPGGIRISGSSKDQWGSKGTPADLRRCRAVRTVGSRRRATGRGSVVPRGTTTPGSTWNMRRDGNVRPCRSGPGCPGWAEEPHPPLATGAPRPRAPTSPRQSNLQVTEGSCQPSLRLLPVGAPSVPRGTQGARSGPRHLPRVPCRSRPAPFPRPSRGDTPDGALDGWARLGMRWQASPDGFGVALRSGTRPTSGSRVRPVDVEGGRGARAG
jgi:hypothetical protein